MRRFYLIVAIAFAGSAGWLAGEDFRGVIKSVDREAGLLFLEGDDGELIPATAPRGDIEISKPGREVRGQLVNYAGGKRLHTIWPADRVGVSTVESVARRLNRDTLLRGRKVFRSTGERFPEFALWNQYGEVVTDRKLRGRYTVTNFIFTRCMNQQMCPLATARMTALQRLAKERGIEDIQLVSFTLDPDYDTPGIFKDYETLKGIDGRNFHLLTGPVEVIEDLKRQMGVLAVPDEQEIINHTMMTMVTDTDNRIFYQIPGTRWLPEDLLGQIERHRAMVEEGK